MDNALYILLPPVLTVAVYTEVKARRIPNWLTGSTIVCALLGATIIGGLPALKDSAFGLLIGGGIFLPFCLVGVLGGGDMKLMAAVGAVVGPDMIWWVLYYTVMAGGAMALASLAWRGELLAGTKRSLVLLMGRNPYPPKKGLRRHPTLPYGIAIAVGALAALALAGR